MCKYGVTPRYPRADRAGATMLNEMRCPEGSARANTIVLTDAPRTTAILRASATMPGAVPAAVIAVAMAVALAVLILWMSVAPRPDRSGTVLETRAYPESTEPVPMYDPTLHMMTVHSVVSGPDWALVVRRSGGHAMTAITVWVPRTAYEACHVGDWYDSSRRVCRL